MLLLRRRCTGGIGVNDPSLHMAKEGTEDEFMAHNPLRGGVWPARLLVHSRPDCGGVTLLILLSAFSDSRGGGLTRGIACIRLGKGTDAAIC